MTKPLEVSVTRLPHGADLPLPSYATEGSAGLDLYAALPDEAPLKLAPGERGAAPTGIAIALPTGFEAQIRPRSGLARKHGLTIVNAPGTVDSDYRGEISVTLINLGTEEITLSRGDRIAQMVVAPVMQITWSELEDLPTTQRGTGGFGSTGTTQRDLAAKS